MNLLASWGTTEPPAWLRAWFPSPFTVSQASLAPNDGPVRLVARVLLGAAMAAAAGVTFSVISTTAAKLALRGDATGLHGSSHHASFGSLLCSASFLPGVGAGLIVLATLLTGARRPQVVRLTLLAVCAHTALRTLSATAPWMGLVAKVVGVALLAVALTSERFTPALARIAAKATPRVFGATAVLTMLSAGAVAGASTRWHGLGALPTMSLTPALSGAAVASGVGALFVAVSAVMLVTARAASKPWGDPDAWLDGTIGEGREISFTSGVAPRRASEVFGDYRGPVVVIPLGEKRKGVFRGDGAPDDGWTVPGTVATLRAASDVSSLSANVTALAVLCLALTAVASSLIAALRAY